jgi:hypothetical protein
MRYVDGPGVTAAAVRIHESYVAEPGDLLIRCRQPGCGALFLVRIVAPQEKPG